MTGLMPEFVVLDLDIRESATTGSATSSDLTCWRARRVRSARGQKSGSGSPDIPVELFGYGPDTTTVATIQGW